MIGVYDYSQDRGLVGDIREILSEKLYYVENFYGQTSIHLVSEKVLGISRDKILELVSIYYPNVELVAPDGLWLFSDCIFLQVLSAYDLDTAYAYLRKNGLDESKLRNEFRKNPLKIIPDFNRPELLCKDIINASNRYYDDLVYYL